jgi:endonuclease YncB( thermonuclease family)
MLAVTLVDSYDAELPSFENMLDGLNAAAGPSAGSSDPVAGEPGPVFVSGPWRIAVATSALGVTFDELGLREKADKEWLLVVLDVTNWSDDDAELKASHFTVALAGEAKPVKIARSSLQGVAEALSLTPFSEEQTLAIGSDETIRVVLAFVVPAGGREPHLAHRDVVIPIEETVELDLAPGDLPAPALSPDFSEGEIVSASDGRTMRIALEGESKADRIQLLGVEPADEGSCFENEAENVLDDLVGASVLVEEDTAVSGGDNAVRYVWLINDDGTRTLLNQLLLATGAARADGIPGDARFGSWLESTALGAEQAGIGLWGDC